MSTESLEVRLERVKRLGNLRLDYLKRLYQGHSIVEGYTQHRFDLHLHAEWVGTGLCARFRAASDLEFNIFSRGIRDDLTARPHGNFSFDTDELIMGDHDEFLMFVEVTESLQRSGPCASIVRLQLLDCCNMRSVEPREHARGVPFEVGWARFDRELQTLASRSRVECGQLDNEVVQADTKTAGDVASEHHYSVRNLGVPSVIDPVRFSQLAGLYRRGIRIHLNDSGFGLGFTNIVMEGFKLHEMFISPCEPDVCVF